MTAPLFSPLRLRGASLRNRIVVSPMCQYSSVDGFATDWHLVHLGSRAVGGAAVVIAEATAVTPSGRISPGDLGIWDDAHIPGLRRCADFIVSHGAVAGIQLAHAGRKASVRRPWEGAGEIPLDEGGWTTVAPSALPFRDGDRVPHALTTLEIGELVEAFASAARRAIDAGFGLIELHGAHGYLIHEFLSPLSNHRTDAYGGSFENRVRFALEVTDAVRATIPDSTPLLMRISATDWTDGGWTSEDSVELARRLATHGVDLVDCSTGGNVPKARIPIGPGYQVPFAAAVRREAGVPSGAVGMITEPEQANAIVASGEADVVLLARELLRDPYWPLHAARVLGVPIPWPVQYERART